MKILTSYPNSYLRRILQWILAAYDDKKWESIRNKKLFES